MDREEQPSPAFAIRPAVEEDYDFIIARINDWWGGRNMAPGLARHIYEHFTDTCLTAEARGRIIGFVSGFVSQSRPDEAYIHYAGVDPEFHRLGVGRALYTAFFDLVRARGRTRVGCITSKVNRLSLAFHTGLGFEVKPSDYSEDGLPIHRDHSGPGGDMLVFLKDLD